jgi:hypothetical protein
MTSNWTIDELLIGIIQKVTEIKQLVAADREEEDEQICKWCKQ